jgi:hypothetical protein
LAAKGLTPHAIASIDRSSHFVAALLVVISLLNNKEHDNVARL